MHRAISGLAVAASMLWAGAQADIEECLRGGACSYLQKPIDPEAMVRVLREAVA